MERPSAGLPAIFITEYALARLWQSWGIEPAAMTGHSLGEYACACLAGVMTLEDALSLVALRGELFERIPDGVMLSVRLPEEALRPLLDARPLPRRRQRPGRLRRLRAGGAGGGARSGVDRAGGGVRPAQDHRGRPLRPARSHPGGVRPAGGHLPAQPPHPALGLQPHRHLDHPCGGDRRRLLGAPPAPAGALQRRHQGAAQRPQPGLPGSRPRADARLPGQGPRRGRGPGARRAP